MSCDPPEKPIDPMTITVGDMIFPGRRAIPFHMFQALAVLGITPQRLARPAVLDAYEEFRAANNQERAESVTITEESHKAQPRNGKYRTDADREALDAAGEKRARKALRLAVQRAQSGKDKHNNDCNIWTGEPCDCAAN